MRITRNNWWLTITQPIIGFDEGEGEGTGNAGGEGATGDGTGEGSSGEGGEGAGGSSEGEGKTEDTAGLKSALEKERTDRKKLEKELKAFRTAQQQKEDSEKSEVERLKGENERNSTKATKLAQGFKDSAIRTAILEAAGKAKFRDPSDALRPEIIAALGVEQDDDDPTKVTIDEATVTQAIKDLAKSRPHYVGTEERRLPRSGSSFGGAGNQNNQGDAEKQDLMKKYPVLRGL